MRRRESGEIQARAYRSRSFWVFNVAAVIRKLVHQLYKLVAVRATIDGVNAFSFDDFIEGGNVSVDG